MKDIISQYKKHKFFQNSTIVLASLVIGLGVNMYVLDGNIGKYLKSSVLDINGVEQTADIYGRVSENREDIALGTQKPMRQVESISLSLVYEQGGVVVEDIVSGLPGATITIVNEELGFTTLLLTFSEPTTLDEETDFLSLRALKKDDNTGYLNIINANFRDSSGENFLLSTSGILF